MKIFVLFFISIVIFSSQVFAQTHGEAINKGPSETAGKYDCITNICPKPSPDNELSGSEGALTKPFKSGSAICNGLEYKIVTEVDLKALRGKNGCEDAKVNSDGDKSGSK